MGFGPLPSASLRICWYVHQLIKQLFTETRTQAQTEHKPMDVYYNVQARFTDSFNLKGLNPFWITDLHTDRVIKWNELNPPEKFRGFGPRIKPPGSSFLKSDILLCQHSAQTENNGPVCMKVYKTLSDRVGQKHQKVWLHLQRAACS